MFIEPEFYLGPPQPPSDSPGRDRYRVGRQGDLGRLAADLQRLIDAHAELGERHRRAGGARRRLLEEGVTNLVLAERARQGRRLSEEKVLEVFALDIELDAQGLASWLDGATWHAIAPRARGAEGNNVPRVIDMLL